MMKDYNKGDLVVIVTVVAAGFLLIGVLIGMSVFPRTVYLSPLGVELRKPDSSYKTGSPITMHSYQSTYRCNIQNPNESTICVEINASTVTSGVVTIQPQPKTTTVTTTVTKIISESEAVLTDLKKSVAFWLSDWKYPRVEYKHSFLASPYRVYAEEIRVTPNGGLELYGVHATVVESGKVYEYRSFLVEKEKKK